MGNGKLGKDVFVTAVGIVAALDAEVRELWTAHQRLTDVLVAESTVWRVPSHGARQTAPSEEISAVTTWLLSCRDSRIQSLSSAAVLGDPPCDVEANANRFLKLWEVSGCWACTVHQKRITEVVFFFGVTFFFFSCSKELFPGQASSHILVSPIHTVTPACLPRHFNLIWVFGKEGLWCLAVEPTSELWHKPCSICPHSLGSV